MTLLPSSTAVLHCSFSEIQSPKGQIWLYRLGVVPTLFVVAPFAPYPRVHHDMGETDIATPILPCLYWSKILDLPLASGNSCTHAVTHGKSDCSLRFPGSSRAVCPSALFKCPFAQSNSLTSCFSGQRHRSSFEQN